MNRKKFPFKVPSSHPLADHVAAWTPEGDTDLKITRCAYLALMIQGLDPLSAGAALGIPPEEVERWRAQRPAAGEVDVWGECLGRGIRFAEAEQEASAIQTLRQAATHDWRAALAYLERRFPARWSAKREPPRRAVEPIPVFDFATENGRAAALQWLWAAVVEGRIDAEQATVLAGTLGVTPPPSVPGPEWSAASAHEARGPAPRHLG